MTGITLLGLGPGNPGSLTREAWDAITAEGEIWVRTNQHPTLDGLDKRIAIHSFDHLYEETDSVEQVYSEIVQKIMELGGTSRGVVYAVPGDPFMAEATCPEIARLARERHIPLKIINGVSFLEPVLAALGIDPLPKMVILDGIELSLANVPPFPPDAPALVAQVYSRLVAAEVKMTLNTTYPDDHPVRLVHAAGTSNEKIEDIPLYEIDRSEHIGLLTVLYVPPLARGTSFEEFKEIIARLRAPDGCPWDREQTHETLRSNLLEETYETLAAIESGNPGEMAEELGDLLLQIVLHAQIASEYGEFTMEEVLKGISDKLIRRHPHVFGELKVPNSQVVIKNWEKLKARERARNKKEEKGLLGGVPLALPALAQAQEYQERAARIGFDWKELGGVLDKVGEEIKEVQATANPEELARELGDLFFSLVNLSRWKGVDAEACLRESNRRFRERFAGMEKEATQQGKALNEFSINELDALWEQAKREEKSG